MSALPPAHREEVICISCGRGICLQSRRVDAAYRNAGTPAVSAVRKAIWSVALHTLRPGAYPMFSRVIQALGSLLLK